MWKVLYQWKASASTEHKNSVKIIMCWRNKAGSNISFGSIIASQSSKQTTVVVFQRQFKKLPSSLDSETARKKSVK